MTFSRFLFFLLAAFALPSHPTAQAASNPNPEHRREDFRARIREAELAGDYDQVATLCRAWYASGQYSPGTLNWNYNALMSLETDALLVTQTDDDTYPVWLLQNALGVRPDVRVLNLTLLENDTYRQRIVQQEGMAFVPNGAGFSDFLRVFMSDKNTAPTYFGVLLDKTRLAAIQNDLYLTGLALKYSSRRSGSSGAVRVGVSSRNRIKRVSPVCLPVPSVQLAASGASRLERSTPSWLLAATTPSCASIRLAITA